MRKKYNRTKQSLFALMLIALFAGCGGSSDSDDENGGTEGDSDRPSNNLNESNPGTVEFSSGNWATKIQANLALEANGVTQTSDAITYSDTILNFEEGIYNSCDFWANAPIEDSDFDGDLSDVADELTESLNETLDFDTTTTVTEFGPSHFRIEVAADEFSVTFESKKVSDQLTFDAGTLSVAGDRLDSDISAVDDVCARFEQNTRTGQIDDSGTSYVFGLPYGDTRLIIEIEVDGEELTAGSYDLTQSDDIAIYVETIDQGDDVTGEGSRTPLYNWGFLSEGLLNIEEASSSGLRGDLYFERNGQDGYFEATFDVSFPQLETID